MKPFELLPIGDADDELLRGLQPVVEETFHVQCSILPVRLEPQFALHPERRQYHSSQILQRMQSFLSLDSSRLDSPPLDSSRLLGVAAVDLYIPILTFVFGEAQLGGQCAVISTYRLRQEFYGLPGDRELLRQRLAKEAVHELGHTLNLTHCDDYRCAMAPSHAVEWIDLKGSALCSSCWRKRSAAPAAATR
jgi:archaemetzincin